MEFKPTDETEEEISFLALYIIRQTIYLRSIYTASRLVKMQPKLQFQPSIRTLAYRLLAHVSSKTRDFYIRDKKIQGNGNHI